jgi:23S rRNA pseudouridine1911/1915/1917 synthase
VKPFTLTWEISREEAGTVLREFLKKQHISRAALTDIKFKGGHLLVNDKHETVRYTLQEGDKVQAVFPPEIPSEEMVVEYIPLHIVYEDEYVLVINKQANMPTIPSREHRSGTLANALLGYYERIGLISTVHVVTRLDKDTSGLMLIAKNRFVHHLLAKQQKEHKIVRTYAAIVHGELTNKVGTIAAPIGRKSDSIIEREVRPDGQEAVTHYVVDNVCSEYSLVTLQLETGRTHQIRVHMLSIGHPLLGDDLYGGRTDKIKRQALHSKQLTFDHPFTGETLTLQVELPEDMRLIIRKPH